MNTTENEKAVSTVYEDDYGVTRCGECEAELFCDENGDMYDICPECGRELDYNFYDPQYRP